MKVRELITLLQDQNQELEVTTGFGQITSVATEHIPILDTDMVFIRTLVKCHETPKNDVSRETVSK